MSSTASFLHTPGLSNIVTGRRWVLRVHVVKTMSMSMTMPVTLDTCEIFTCNLPAGAPSMVYVWPSDVCSFIWYRYYNSNLGRGHLPLSAVLRTIKTEGDIKVSRCTSGDTLTSLQRNARTSSSLWQTVTAVHSSHSNSIGVASSIFTYPCVLLVWIPSL